MELSWYGRTCIRLRGRDAVVVSDPYQSVVGPTGRGITGEIVTYSHPDDRPLAKAKGSDRGKQTAFLVELDGLHTIHLGEIGHLLTEEKLADIGSVDIACVPIGGPLSATKTAELIAQLDPRIVVAMPLDEDAPGMGVAKFFHEMGGEPTPQPRLSVTMSSLPAETTAVLLESRGKT
jgi:L-ascorbate metabolism protein UlaG (beta-lactamase superfamily)